MFPGGIISHLKQILYGGEGNDRKRKGAMHLDVESKKPRMTTMSSIPAPVIVSTGKEASEAAGVQQNGAYGSYSRSLMNARCFSESDDRVPGISLNMASSMRRIGIEPRPVSKRSNGPPNLIPITHGLSRPSVAQRSSGFGTGTKGFAGTSSVFSRATNESIPTLTSLSERPRPSLTTTVPELSSEFRNLLRTKYGSSSTEPKFDVLSSLDPDLLEQQEAHKKYEALMKKFIPIATDPPPRGAYDRFARKIVNGDIQRSSVTKPSSIETFDLTDDEDNEDETTEQEADDGCVGVDASGKSIRLFTTIDPAQIGLTDERDKEQEAKPQQPTETVNTVKERFQTKQVFRENIIQDVQQRYGALFSQRKSLIEQEKERLDKLKQTTAAQENEMRSKMLNYVCSFYSFDVFDETELRDVTPEPKDVPLPELSKEHLDLMYRKLRAGGQVVMEKFNLPITGNDLVTLQGMNWLNDAVINFYMELLRERSEQKKDQGLPKVYAMNTFFLPRLLQNGHGGVRRWTRKVDLLAHDMIVIPVHVSGIHWCLSTIDLRRKTIHYYDSMGAPNNEVLNALENYLCEESLDKRKTPFDTTGLTKQNIRDCPQQKNGSDCGVFSCMFAEFLTRDHAITFDQSKMQYFRQKMTIEIMLGKLLT